MIVSLLWWALIVVGIVFGYFWSAETKRKGGLVMPTWLGVAIGFVTNFFDTLGIGSFAPTTALFKFFKTAPDEEIPGTLNVGHLLPTIVEALAYIALVKVDPLTLVLMIVAAVAGSYFGAGIVARLPRRGVQVGMGVALLVAAAFFVAKEEAFNPAGASLGLTGWTLAFAVFANFWLGALMTLGIGMYAPAMILVGLLGMNPKAAFPIMMGSCAFLMPTAGARFLRLDRYTLKAALGLTLGGIPGVLIAAFIVKSLDVYWLRWGVVFVVVIAAAMMLHSAYSERRPAAVPA